MTRQNIRRSILEIYDIYCQKTFTCEFTLDSISIIFEIGNEIFLKDNEQEIEKLINRPPSNAPDIMDDEPYSLDRSITIYESLSPKYKEVDPELIQSVFELNSKFAWKEYKRKYKEYILSIHDDYQDDEYINYLASVLYYEAKDFSLALKCINFALSQNSSSSLFTHIKGLCLIQLGEFDTARTYLYQALFLIELLQDVPPRLKAAPEIYPNYPIEYHTSAELVRLDLDKLDKADTFFKFHVMPLVEAQSV
jgi:tetratricopeptide (TPR) repeat protein